MDSGLAVAKVAGLLRRILFFTVALPYSDTFFVMAFERECTETYWERRIRAFDFFGGVPHRITCGDTKVLVSKIIGPHDRRLTDAFLQLKSHYLFDHRFCRAGRPNEKGVVEGVVKFARLNFFVPVPQVRDLEELNGELALMCREDMKRKLRGKGAPKSELLADDQAAFLTLPPAPLDACRKQSTTASSLSLVRFDCNDYSVPVRHAHHPVAAKENTMKSTEKRNTVRNMPTLLRFTCPRCGGHTLRQFEGTRTYTIYDISVWVDDKDDPNSARIAPESAPMYQSRDEPERDRGWECGTCGTPLCGVDGSPLGTASDLAEWLVRNSPAEDVCEDMEFQCPGCGGKTPGLSDRISIKAVVTEDGRLETVGSDVIHEEERIFGCWNCEFVIEDENGPIRDLSAVVEWLKQNCEQDG